MGQVVVDNVESFLQQSLVHRGEGSEEGRTPDPGASLRRLPGYDYRGLAHVAEEIVTVETLPLRLLAGKRLRGVDGGSLVAASQRAVNFGGYQRGALLIGVDAVDIKVGMWFQHLVEVDNGQAAFLRHAAQGRNDVGSNDAVAYAEVRFHCGDGQAEINLGVRRQCLKLVQHFVEVGLELLSVAPVPGFAIIGSQFDGDDVRFELQQIAEEGFVHIGAVSLVQQHTAADSKIADVVLLAHQLGKHTGVTVLEAVLDAPTVSDAVAHAGNLHGLFLLCHHTEAEEAQAKQKDVFLLHDTYLWFSVF